MLFFTPGRLPVYVDVRPDTYCLDPDKLEEALTDRTKVILCQNTYGLSAEVEKVVEIARRRGIFTIEDCAHGFGGTYQGKANGTYCDAAFFSTQWNKPFSTGLGGFAVVNNQALLPKVEALEKEKQRPTLGETNLTAPVDLDAAVVGPGLELLEADGLLPLAEPTQPDIGLFAGRRIGRHRHAQELSQRPERGSGPGGAAGPGPFG